ncbi:DUF1062 domain-containing protein [Ensifer adhaerens]|nr:DUF1062 domain-containing protein [Ensifer adhaerens]
MPGGRRLDAWLIYRCAVCEDTWNRPIFERRNVASVAPDASKQRSRLGPPGGVRHRRSSRQCTDRIEDLADSNVERHVLGGSAGCARLEIVLVVRSTVSCRCIRRGGGRRSGCRQARGGGRIGVRWSTGPSMYETCRLVLPIGSPSRRRFEYPFRGRGLAAVGRDGSA